jgi:beta-lactamase superfamily II metal-dependent hydrolase
MPLLAGLWAAASCGGTTAVDPDPDPIVTVSGIADGDSVTGPVTILVSVDRGTFSATLNEENFVSGRTITAPGDYALEVFAVNGTASVTVTVEFTILLGGETALIIRILNLGNNPSGGGGDAAIITDSSGAGMRHGLIDAGPAGQGGSDPNFVRSRLAAFGIDTLEFVVLTHAHTDHFGGMLPVLQNVHIRTFFYNGQARNLTSYQQVLSTAGARAETVTIPSAPAEFTLGFGGSATGVAVVPPLATYISNSSANASQINEGSLGTEVVKGAFRAFFAGDGEVQANANWRGNYGQESGALTALKVGHHGANDAIFDNGFNTGLSWLNHADPDLALVSANGVTHPRLNATAALLARVGLTTYCTNVHGDIEIRVNEAGAYQVTVERNDSSACQAGSQADT